MSSTSAGAAGLLRPSPHCVFLGIIAGSGRINYRMHLISTLRYSTLWAISVPQPIHSLLAAEWITSGLTPASFLPLLSFFMR